MKDSLQPWINLINKDRWDDDKLKNIIHKIPANFQLLIALILSIAKWHPSNPWRGMNICALCAYRDMYLGGKCTNCVLIIDKKACAYPGHPWGSWEDASCNDDEENEIKYADILYEKLEELYAAEYKKLTKEEQEQLPKVMKKHLEKYK
jgi:hypothetical protein